MSSHEFASYLNVSDSWQFWKYCDISVLFIEKVNEKNYQNYVCL